MIKISVVIPTFNRREHLKQLLIQLNEISGQNYCLEIIVVVDGSTDGTLELLKKEFDFVHIVEGDGNWWYTKSMNEGFNYSKRFNSKYTLLLNDDVILGLNYIENIVKAAESKNDSIVSSICFSHETPHLLFDAGVKEIKWWRFKFIKYLKQLGTANPKDYTGLYPTLAITGRGTLIPTNLLFTLNLYDEGFKQYGSDIELGFRASANSIKMFVSWDAQIFSIVNTTGKGASFIKSSFFDFIKSQFNPYSMNYLPDSFRIAWRYGIKLLFPLTCSIILLGNLKAYCFNKKY
ncbi:MAG: glycosyltransferase family 2 protein [Sphingobacteriaceae bacterium]|nr:glycosyltransferase family 2 protein [Sphingobacteriaceae bacterium]